MLFYVVEIVDGCVVSGWCQMCLYMYIYVSEDLAAEYLAVIVIINND